MSKRNCRPFSVISHAAVMVIRNLRSYALLSVTITMSFVLLLGYLVYQDSELNHKYKAILACDPNVAVLQDGGQSDSKLALLQEKVHTLGQTYSYDIFSTQVIVHNTKLVDQRSGKELRYPSININCLSRGVFGIYRSGTVQEVTWLPGQEREMLDLQAGEAIMEDAWFYALGLDQQETPVYQLALSAVNGTEPEIYLNLRIVGTVETSRATGAGIVQEVPGEEGYLFTEYSPSIYISMEDLSPERSPESFYWFQKVVFYTTHPYELLNYAEQIYGSTAYDSSTFYSNVRELDMTLEQIRNANRVKMIVAGALLLLLGINLYSSFANALSSRKFEIGVKRALGASPWSIVRQFLLESVLVMAGNVFLSVCLVADLAIIYKYIREHIPDAQGTFHPYIIYFSEYSMAMFGVCSVSLTIVFSLIFAYRSTQVQIVDYLKAE